MVCRLSSADGSKAWPFLQELHADKNFLNGSLPVSWGSGGSMQVNTSPADMLLDLYIERFASITSAATSVPSTLTWPQSARPAPLKFPGCSTPSGCAPFQVVCPMA